MKKVFIILPIVFFCAFPQSRGNGDRIDSLPNLLERQLLVLTNACRMAPVQYRDLYIGNYQVLLPANYPTVKPLYWNLPLNRSARVQSVDMANKCGMQHNSCDGTAWNTRIRSYYTKSQTIAENIATGNNTALATVKQWVLEVDPGRETIPADRSSGDGHRQNIMSASYNEMGPGYAKGPKQYTYFWVQDFGGGAPDFLNPLVTGCHFFIETGKTTFLVNYSDSLAPSEINCMIDNQTYPLTLALGSTARGTYSLVQTKASACRRYYFSCTRSGERFRYPEYGMLITSGEGSCAADYIPPESLTVRISGQPACYGSIRCAYLYPGKILLTGLPDHWTAGTVTVMDPRGRILQRFRVKRSLPGQKPSILVPFYGHWGTASFIIATFDDHRSWIGMLALAG
jgi:hypothetical protein